jgi:hypothetical protein
VAQKPVGPGVAGLFRIATLTFFFSFSLYLYNIGHQLGQTVRPAP